MRIFIGILSSVSIQKGNWKYIEVRRVYRQKVMCHRASMSYLQTFSLWEKGNCQFLSLLDNAPYCLLTYLAGCVRYPNEIIILCQTYQRFSRGTSYTNYTKSIDLYFLLLSIFIFFFTTAINRFIFLN